MRMHRKVAGDALAGLVAVLAALSLAGCVTYKAGLPLNYLALGDSAPFGYRQLADTGQYQDDGNFTGYPEIVAEDRGLNVLNTSCPGETSESFLDEDAGENYCTNADGSGQGYRSRYPLHTKYDGAQVDRAVSVLAASSGIRLVTLQLGANDAYYCVLEQRCTTPEGVTDMADSVRSDIDTALAALRSEYDGRIVVVNYYPPNYYDPAGLAIIGALNGAIADAAGAHGALVADAFSAFRTAAQGGDVIDAGLVWPGDTHPTPEGQRVLADAVEAVL